MTRKACFKEQIIPDPLNKLIVKIWLAGDEPRITLIGEKLEFGNRDFQFDKNGGYAGTGTYVGGSE